MDVDAFYWHGPEELQVWVKFSFCSSHVEFEMPISPSGNIGKAVRFLREV